MQAFNGKTWDHKYNSKKVATLEYICKDSILEMLHIQNSDSTPILESYCYLQALAGSNTNHST